MARYTGPTSKIARRFREPIFGEDKALERKNYPPGQHGPNKRRGKQSEYSVQLLFFHIRILDYPVLMFSAMVDPYLMSFFFLSPAWLISVISTSSL